MVTKIWRLNLWDRSSGFSTSDLITNHPAGRQLLDGWTAVLFLLRHRPSLLRRNTLTESWRQLLWHVKESSSLLWGLALQRRGQSRNRAGFTLEPFRFSLEVWQVRGKKDKESEEPSRDPPDLQHKPMKSMVCQAGIVVVVQMAGWKAARDVEGGWGEKRESWKMSVRCERLKVGQDVEEWSVSVWECTAPCVQSLFTSGTADGQQIWTNSG